MIFKKGDIVRRLYDKKFNTNFLWEVTNFIDDGIGNTAIKINNILNNNIEYCYPEQLEKLEVRC